MNRGLNLPQIQRIMNEFEKESSTMDMKEEMMSDAVDDVMDDELEDEEAEGDKILKEVLDEIGIGLAQEVSSLSTRRSTIASNCRILFLVARHTYITRVNCSSAHDGPSSCGTWSFRWTFVASLWRSRWRWWRGDIRRRCTASPTR